MQTFQSIMKIWRGQFFPAAMAAAIFLTGCNKPSSAPDAGGDTIKVGEFASMTGSEATFGQSSHKGTALAIDDLNAAGGVLGKKLELLMEDDQSQAGQPATVVRKLISRDGVMAILGEVASSRSLEAAPICQENKTPMISPSSTNPKVTAVGDYIFRVCFIDPFQGTVMANFALNTLHLKNVAVLTDVKSDYSLGLAKFFKEGFVAGGGKTFLEKFREAEAIIALHNRQHRDIFQMQRVQREIRHDRALKRINETHAENVIADGGDLRVCGRRRNHRDFIFLADRR